MTLQLFTEVDVLQLTRPSANVLTRCSPIHDLFSAGVIPRKLAALYFFSEPVHP